MKAPSVSRLGYAILGLLKDRALSGYDVRQEFTSSPMGHYSDSPGAIYPALKRLPQNFDHGEVVGLPHGRGPDLPHDASLGVTLHGDLVRP